MPGLGGILGNPALEQIFLYNVVGMILSSALGPYMVALANEVNQLTPLVPLSPADMADAVIRNIVSEDAGASEAAFGGVNRERFHQLTLLAGNAPDPTSMAVALRRGLVTQDRYMTGIRQGRLRDEWADLVRELAVQQPTPMDAMTALVEGQLPEADARAKYAAFGGDPAQFDWLYGTVGAGPSPLEAGVMAHRGLIPWDGTGLGVVSFTQAVHEGHTRNKWTTAYRGLTEYLPPPRTVTAMHREGALTTPQAAKILEQHGLTPALAGAYLAASSHAKTAKAKELAESTVLSLYRDRIIPKAEAETFLARLAYTPQETAFILEVEDFRLAERFIQAAVGRIHTLYVGRKVGQAEALTALAELGVEAKQAGELVAIWDHERAATHKVLTPAQIEAAFGHAIIDQPTAMALLEAQGYAQHDAWMALSVHAKKALPDEPAGGSIPAPAGP